MSDYRRWLHQQEPHKTIRAQAAADYRSMRRDNPKIARLLFVKVQETKWSMIAKFWDRAFYGSTGPGGIAELFK